MRRTETVTLLADIGVKEAQLEAGHGGYSLNVHPTSAGDRVRPLVSHVMNFLRDKDSRVFSRYAKLGYPSKGPDYSEERVWTVRLSDVGAGTSLGLGIMALIVRHIVEGLLHWADEDGKLPAFYATGEVSDLEKLNVSMVGALKTKIEHAQKAFLEHPQKDLQNGKPWLLVPKDQEREAVALGKNVLNADIVPIGSIHDLLTRIKRHLGKRVTELQAELEAKGMSRRVTAGSEMRWPGRADDFFAALFATDGYQHLSKDGEEWDKLFEELFLLKHAATDGTGRRRRRAQWLAGIAAGFAVAGAVGFGIWAWRSKANGVVDAATLGRAAFAPPVGPAHVDTLARGPAPEPLAPIVPSAREPPAGPKAPTTPKRKQPAHGPAITVQAAAPDTAAVTSKCVTIAEVCPQTTSECVTDFYRRACGREGINQHQQTLCNSFVAKGMETGSEFRFFFEAEAKSLCDQQ